MLYVLPLNEWKHHRVHTRIAHRDPLSRSKSLKCVISPTGLSEYQICAARLLFSLEICMSPGCTITIEDVAVS